MSRQPPPWSDLQLLVQVRAAGSMLGAARRLGLAASTVGRRLSHLEEQVGAVLLERSPYGVRLTPAGETLADCGAQMQLMVSRALRELPRGGQALSGMIRVSAGDGFSEIILAAIKSMHQAHPQVQFELVLEDRPVDLSRREADVAIRTFHQGEGTLVYQRIGTLPYGLFASGSYLEAHGAPQQLPALRGHRWLGFCSPLDQLEANQWMSTHMGTGPAVAASSFQGLLGAVRADLGLAALPRVAAAGLEAVLPELSLPGLPVWMVVHRDVRPQPHIAAFLAFLRQGLEALLDEA